MPANIEIKARLRDPVLTKSVARKLSGWEPKMILQKDTYFECSSGRLKLREFPGGRGELIFYERSDVAGSKRSDYSISATDDSKPLVALLTAALGVRTVVRTRRELFLVGQTRIHLDDVEGLGSFLELEVVLRENQPSDEGHLIAKDLMRNLVVLDADLIEGSYADLQNVCSRIC